MNHTTLMILTAKLPMKTIEIDGEPYLQRYHVYNDEDGTQHWLHRFLRNDSERHLHSHPWSATSMILCGGYTAQESDYSGHKVFRNYYAGGINEINENTLHRISSVQPDTWTSMTVYAGRLPQWYFIGDEGNKKLMDTSPEDWWKDCGIRK